MKHISSGYYFSFSIAPFNVRSCGNDCLICLSPISLICLTTKQTGIQKLYEIFISLSLSLANNSQNFNNKATFSFQMKFMRMNNLILTMVFIRQTVCVFTSYDAQNS